MCARNSRTVHQLETNIQLHHNRKLSKLCFGMFTDKSICAYFNEESPLSTLSFKNVDLLPSIRCDFFPNFFTHF